MYREHWLRLGCGVLGFIAGLGIASWIGGRYSVRVWNQATIYRVDNWTGSTAFFSSTNSGWKAIPNQ